MSYLDGLCLLASEYLLSRARFPPYDLAAVWSLRGPVYAVDLRTRLPANGLVWSDKQMPPHRQDDALADDGLAVDYAREQSSLTLF